MCKVINRSDSIFAVYLDNLDLSGVQIDNHTKAIIDQIVLKAICRNINNRYACISQATQSIDDLVRNEAILNAAILAVALGYMRA